VSDYPDYFITPYPTAIEKKWKWYPKNQPLGVKSSTTVWVYGDWVEIISATELTVNHRLIAISIWPDAAVQMQWDIGTGSAGNETPDLVEALPCFPKVFAYGALDPYPWILPWNVVIPKLTRVAIRVADSSATAYKHYVKIAVQET